MWKNCGCQALSIFNSQLHGLISQLKSRVHFKKSKVHEIMNNGYFANVGSTKRKLIKFITRAMRKFMPNTALRLSHNIVLTPVKRVSHWPKSVLTHNYKTSFGNIKVHHVGKGPTILMVHGWSGCGFQFWPLMQTLSKRGYCCITFDFPAHGLSEGKRSSLPKMVRAFDEIISQLPQPGLVITHSMGASAMANSEWFKTFDGELMLIAPVLETFNLLQYSVNKSGFDQKLFERMIEDAFYSEQMSVPDLDVISPLINFPGNLKIVHDEHDKFAPVNASNRLAELAGAELYLTQNLGHGRILKSKKISELT